MKPFTTHLPLRKYLELTKLNKLSVGQHMFVDEHYEVEYISQRFRAYKGHHENEATLQHMYKVKYLNSSLFAEGTIGWVFASELTVRIKVLNFITI